MMEKKISIVLFHVSETWGFQVRLGRGSPNAASFNSKEERRVALLSLVELATKAADEDQD